MPKIVMSSSVPIARLKDGAASPTSPKAVRSEPLAPSNATYPPRGQLSASKGSEFVQTRDDIPSLSRSGLKLAAGETARRFFLDDEGSRVMHDLGTTRVAGASAVTIIPP